MNLGISIDAKQAQLAAIGENGILQRCPDRLDTTCFLTSTSLGWDGQTYVVGQRMMLRQAQGRNLPCANFLDLLEQRQTSEFASGLENPTVAAASLLLKLRQDAFHLAHRSIRHVVIAVSEELSAAAAQTLRQAAVRVGFESLAIVDASRACLEFFASRHSLGRLVLCLDTTSESPSVSLFRNVQGRIETLQKFTQGEPFLTSRYRDIADGYLLQLREQADPETPADRFPTLAQLELLAEQQCQLLEENTAPWVSKKLLVGDRLCQVFLSRNKLSQLCKELVETAAFAADECLLRSRILMTEIEQVILIGPLVQTPQFHEHLAKELQLPRSSIIAETPRQAIVQGAALLAARRRKSVGLVRRDPASGSFEVEPLFTGTEQLPVTIRKSYRKADASGKLALRFVAWDNDLDQAALIGGIDCGSGSAAASDRWVDLSLTYGVDDELRVVAYERSAKKPHHHHLKIR